MNMKIAEQDGYEKQDVNVIKVLLIGFGGIIFLAVMIIFLIDYFIGSREDIMRQVALEPVSSELIELRHREQTMLGSYGVENRITGRYHIPIERAIQLVAEDYRSIQAGSKEK